MINLNTSVVFSPWTLHATNSLKYHNAYHVCLLLSFVFLHKNNIAWVLDDITTIYPSKTGRVLLLRWTCISHWKCWKGGCDSVIIPSLDNDNTYGRNWMAMFKQLASFKNASESIVAEESPHKLCRWMSQQCFYFSMKYSTSKSDATMKCGKLLTPACEAKLKSIGFCFIWNKDVSLHESKWMKKFEQAKEFYKLKA
jgi:hypothetical protein